MKRVLLGIGIGIWIISQLTIYGYAIDGATEEAAPPLFTLCMILGNALLIVGIFIALLKA